MLSFTLFVSFLLSGALASTSITETTHSVLRCSTRYDNTAHQGPIPTSIRTSTNNKPPVWIYSTSTPVVLQQAPPVTKTSTVFSVATTTVTDLAVTDVFTSVSTLISTTTALETSTSTSWSTESTTSTSTVTSVVPTNVGFLPIESTVPTNYPRKRSLGAREALARPVQQELLREKVPKSHPRYEQVVSCKDVINIRTIGYVTFTAPTSVSKLPAKTLHTISTSTFTSTSTVVPADVLSTTVSTTLFLVTSTSTATSVVTSTTTSTIEAVATATTLGACAANNFVGPTFNGQLIDTFAPAALSPKVDYFYLTTDDAYHCCAACINTFGCTYSGFFDGTCVVVTSDLGTCNGQSPFAAGYSHASFPGESGAVLSNGNCGYMFYAD